MATKDWITLAFTVLTFLAGSGWLKYFLERRDARRKEQRAVVEGFLRPLEAILEANGRIQAVLTADPQLQNLEFDPEHLQRYFSSLQGTDIRRITWRGLIDSVVKDNERAKLLIQSNAGRVSAEFREAAADFVQHAEAWAALWRSATGNQPVVKKGSHVLSTPAYPKAFDVALAAEIRRKTEGVD